MATQPVITFGAFAVQWLDDVEDGFSNPKHRQQWRNTLQAYSGFGAGDPVISVFLPIKTGPFRFPPSSPF